MAEFFFAFQISSNKFRPFQIIISIQSIGSPNIMQITICMVGVIIFKLGMIDGFGLKHDFHYLLEKLTEKMAIKTKEIGTITMMKIKRNNNNNEGRRKTTVMKARKKKETISTMKARKNN